MPVTVRANAGRPDEPAGALPGALEENGGMTSILGGGSGAGANSSATGCAVAPGI